MNKKFEYSIGQNVFATAYWDDTERIKVSFSDKFMEDEWKEERNEFIRMIESVRPTNHSIRYKQINNQISIVEAMSSHNLNQDDKGYFVGNCFKCKSPNNLKVNDHKGIFYCFGCHIGGDVITYVAIRDGVSIVDASEKLVEQFNLKI